MKQKTELTIIILAILYIAFNGCQYTFGVEEEIIEDQTFDKLLVDPEFNFSLDNIIELDVEDDQILNVFTITKEETSHLGKLISGAGKLQIPNSTESIFYHVLPNDLKNLKSISGGNKMIICHIPPGNPSNAQTIEISVNAWPAHRDNHGDYEGGCENDSFEDSDGDGVVDYIDDFPYDSLFAYTSYYPNSDEMATLLFEDMWPMQGDYDFNDFVLYYKLTYKKNSNNKIVGIDYTFNVAAIGGIKNSSFFVRLLDNNLNPIPQTIIQNVSGNNLAGGIVNIRSNGTEFGTEEAVIPVIDNTRNAFESMSSGKKINVVIGEPIYDSDTTTVSILLSEPFNENEIYFDPFLTIDFDREKEIHLPVFGPTEIAKDSDLFGTEDDNSNLENAYYYRSHNHFPWALNIPREIAYPKENADFSITYNEFSEWAESQGNQKKQWYFQQNGKYKPNKIFRRNNN